MANWYTRMPSEMREKYHGMTRSTRTTITEFLNENEAYIVTKLEIEEPFVFCEAKRHGLTLFLGYKSPVRIMKRPSL
jgi:hypothetical protein